MREIRRGSEYAIVAQFVYTTADLVTQRLESAKQYELLPGEGIIFLCDGDNNPVDEVPFTQDRREVVLNTLQEGSFLQMVAVLEQNTGSLLLTPGSSDQSFILGHDRPDRIVTIRNGRVVYGGIWGPTKREAERTFRVMQEMHRRLN